MPRQLPASPSARTAAVATAIATFAVFDWLIAGVPTAALAAWLDPVVVFGTVTIALTVFTVVCCEWIEHRWATRADGTFPRVEARLAKMRHGRLTRHPVAWITRGSDAWYVLAAALANAIIVVATTMIALASAA